MYSPVMLTVASAEFAAEKLNQKPIYSKLAINQYRTLGLNISNNLLVKDVMKQPITFTSNILLINALKTIKKEGHTTYPVVDDNNKLLGIIKKDDIKDALRDNNKDYIDVTKILDTTPPTVYENEDLYIAFFRIHENSEDCAIVIDNEKNVLGIISRKDILNENE